MPTFVNLTPHEICIVNEQNEITRRFPASGQVAHLEVKQVPLSEIDGVSLYATVHGEIKGLPPFDGETYYIVSMPVAQAVPSYRFDVVAPDTGPTAYRVQGKIVGVRAFTLYDMKEIL